MMNLIYKSKSFVLIFLLPFMLVACNSSDAEEEGTIYYEATEVVAQAQPSVITPAPIQAKLKASIPDFAGMSIIGNDNTEIAKIENNQRINIYLNGSLIHSKIGSSGKRKYLNEQDQVIAKINRYDYGFKVKSESGEVLWKVKNKEGKIKIANNDEMNNAFKIKQKNKIKIYKNDDEVGKGVKMDSYLKITSTSGNKLNVFKAQAMYAAVMGIEEIPLEQRLIILAELSYP